MFIDEIQYLANPTNFLKFIYDEYKDKIKLFVSGSSAFYIDSKFTDSLAGRKKIFILNNLSFSEFLKFKNENKLKTEFDKIDFKKKDLSIYNVIDNKKIDILKNEYMRFGGYPRIVLEKDIEKKCY